MTALLPHLRRARAQSVLASILLALVVFAPAAFAAAADSAKADSAAKDTPWKVEDEHGPSEMVERRNRYDTTCRLQGHAAIAAAC
jgi:hypothetical protein